jgi:hypothetical protein
MYCVDPKKGQRGPSKSTMDVLNPTPKDLALKTALKDWRQSTAFLKFRPATIRNLGVRILMTDVVLNRIVDCAHFGKLTAVEQLLKETTWPRERIQEFGETIITLINDHHPPAPANTALSVEGDAQPKRSIVRCSACGVVGHNSEFVGHFLIDYADRGQPDMSQAYHRRQQRKCTTVASHAEWRSINIIA